MFIHPQPPLSVQVFLCLAAAVLNLSYLGTSSMMSKYPKSRPKRAHPEKGKSSFSHLLISIFLFTPPERLPPSGKCNPHPRTFLSSKIVSQISIHFRERKKRRGGAYVNRSLLNSIKCKNVLFC